MKFEGIFPVAITPFLPDGGFDYPAAKKHLDYLIDSGVHGVCILGATSEYMSITNDEHKEYVREIVPYIKDRTTVVVGATRERADDVIDLVRNAKEWGAHGAMLLCPPYCHPAQDEIVEHYRYIMEQTAFPLVIYNNPGSSGVSIETETFLQLFRLPYTAVIKESSGEMQTTTRTVLAAPENISVFCGCDNLAFESFAAGANGWISMLANVAPKDCVDLFEAVYRRRNLDEGMAIYKRILPALEYLESGDKTVQSLKYLATRKHGGGGCCRRPRIELSEEEKAHVIAAMDADHIQ